MNRGLQDGGWPGVPSSHNVNIYVPITGLARLAIETFTSENNKFPPELTTRMNQSASWASPWPALLGHVWSSVSVTRSPGRPSEASRGRKVGDCKDTATARLQTNGLETDLGTSPSLFLSAIKVVWSLLAIYTELRI